MKWMVPALLAVLLGCDGCRHPSPEPKTPAAADASFVGDAPLWNGGPATCTDYCQRGQVLGCSWANPTPAGAACVSVCKNYQAVGVMPWDLDCRVRQTSCAAMDEACQ